MNNPKLIPLLFKIKLEVFSDEQIKNIALCLVKCYNDKQENPIQFLLLNNENKDYLNYLLMLGEKIFSDQFFSSNDLKRDIKNIIFELHKNLISSELKRIKKDMSLAEAANDKQKLSILDEDFNSRVKELQELEDQRK